MVAIDAERNTNIAVVACAASAGNPNCFDEIETKFDYEASPSIPKKDFHNRSYKNLVIFKNTHRISRQPIRTIFKYPKKPNIHIFELFLLFIKLLCQIYS